MQNIFSKQNWNSKLTEYWNDKNPESIINRFSNKFDNDKQINSLNLEKIYILTTGGSASASELIINGLKHFQILMKWQMLMKIKF